MRSQRNQRPPVLHTRYALRYPSSPHLPPIIRNAGQPQVYPCSALCIQEGIGDSQTMNRIVQFSGGLCSYFAARRVVEQFGIQDVTLLFADTLCESPGLYKFLEQGAASLGLAVTRIADGRTIWQVFKD